MPNKVLNVTDLQISLANFAKDRDWDQFHSPKNLAMALSVEAGELLEIFQWLTAEESRAVAKDDKLKGRAAEEIADILLYVLRIADQLNVDVDAACRNKLEINARKYPVDLAKGNAKKYTELKRK